MAAPPISNVKVGEIHVMASSLRPSLPEFLSGLVCIFQCNARQAYVVPSTQNFLQFADNTDETTPIVQIRGAKLDHGTDSSLFYFSSSAAFISYIENAPTAENSPEHGIQYSIKYTDTPCGPLVTLRMRRVYDFLLYLARDVVTPSIPIRLPHLTFHLCSEDLDELVNCTNLPLRVMQSLMEYRKLFQGRIIKRRKWALLGNDVSAQFALFKPRKVFFMCDMSVYNLRSYAHLFLDEGAVMDMNYLEVSNPECEEPYLSYPDSEELHLIEDEVVPCESVDYRDFL